MKISISLESACTVHAGIAIYVIAGSIKENCPKFAIIVKPVLQATCVKQETVRKG